MDSEGRCNSPPLLAGSLLSHLNLSQLTCGESIIPTGFDVCMLSGKQQSVLLNVLETLRARCYWVYVNVTLDTEETTAVKV